jgi:superfamily II DNA/RNA helicase
MWRPAARMREAARGVQVLRELLPSGSPTIIFVSTKHRVEYLTQLLEQVRPMLSCNGDCFLQAGSATAALL